MDRDALLNARVRIPDHVVHRTFVAETVVLNLKTGKYHGLNPMAGRMLEVLAESGSVRDAAALIATTYGQDQATVETDLVAFCRELLDRSLVEVVDESS